VAGGVPSLGYKAFRVIEGEAPALAVGAPVAADAPPVMENRYYRVEFDLASGAIRSIIDKERQAELVDQAAPHQFNTRRISVFSPYDTAPAAATHAPQPQNRTWIPQRWIAAGSDVP
jgi:hypothetical protein